MTDNTNPNMTYYCHHCDENLPIEKLLIVQDASVSFSPKFSGGRWHTTPPEIDNVNLYEDFTCQCGTCGEELDEPDVPQSFWMWADDLPSWWNEHAPSGTT